MMRVMTMILIVVTVVRCLAMMVVVAMEEVVLEQEM